MKILHGTKNGIIKINQCKYFYTLTATSLKARNTKVANLTGHKNNQ